MKVASCGLRFRGRNRILKKRNPQPATFIENRFGILGKRLDVLFKTL